MSAVRYSAEWLQSLDRATVTAAEAARVLGVTSPTIHAMVDRGELIGRQSVRIMFVSVPSLCKFIGISA